MEIEVHAAHCLHKFHQARAGICLCHIYLTPMDNVGAVGDKSLKHFSAPSCDTYGPTSLCQQTRHLKTYA